MDRVMWKCAVLYHKGPHVSQTSWHMAFTKCFQPLESEATQVQKSEVTYCLEGLFCSKIWQDGQEIAAADDDDDEKLSTKDGWRWEVFHRPWIRICGWWGTGAGRRVFLPGLAGGQGCVRWLGWGTVEEEKGLRVSEEGTEALWKLLSGEELQHCHCSGFLFFFFF